MASSSQLVESLPRRGGRQQRRARLEASTEPKAAPDTNVPASTSEQSKFDSELVARLISDWAWGSLSAIEVQKIAALAHADQITLIDKMRSALASNSAVLALHHMQPSMSLERLAAIGARGRQPGNCHRDLLEWLGQPRSPPPTNFDIPIKDPKPKRLQAAIRDLSSRSSYHMLNLHMHFPKVVKSLRSGFWGVA